MGLFFRYFPEQVQKEPFLTVRAGDSAGMCFALQLNTACWYTWQYYTIQYNAIQNERYDRITAYIIPCDSIGYNSTRIDTMG